MLIAIPREINPLEGWLGLNSSACSEHIRTGHTMLLERGVWREVGLNVTSQYPLHESLAHVVADTDLLIGGAGQLSGAKSRHQSGCWAIVHAALKKQFIEK